MINEAFAREGPQVLIDGSRALVRLGRSGEVVETGTHGLEYEQAYRQAVFCASTKSPGQILLDISQFSPQTGLAFVNPVGSKVYASLILWELGILTAGSVPVIGAYVFAGNKNPLTPPTFSFVPGTIPVIPGDLGSAPGARCGLSSNASLVSAPSIYRPFVNHLTGASTTIPNLPANFMMFDGTCLIAPGCCLGVYQVNSDGMNVTVVHRVLWEEIPV